MKNLRDGQILRIAVPSIVSNITVPLLGMIDVAIVGHMGSPAYIGAVAVGSMIFNLVYWLFGFLRMGASGMTAQAVGRRDLTEAIRILARSMAIALGIAMLLIILQMPLKWLGFWLIGPTADVSPFAATYFYTVIWGAPASLALFSLMGWFIGMQNTRFPMIISIIQNIVNILASLILVYVLGMKIEGVALGTVIAQYAGFLMAIALFLKYYGRLLPYFRKEGLLRDFRKFFVVNRDIFLRTLCLVAVTLYFTSAGARSGATILAINTVLMQFYLFFSYFMDGFAYAGEALGGKTYGASNRVAFREILQRLFLWATGVTLVFTLTYVFAGQWIVKVLTDEPQVLDAAKHFLPWAWLIPIAGVAAFIWDGIFVGITATRGMLISSFVAALFFFVIFLLSKDTLGNHGLWLAFITYLAMRGITQTIIFFSSTH